MHIRLPKQLMWDALQTVFERFSEDARQAITYASDAARELGHGHIGSEHLLVGLLQDTAQVPAHILVPLGVDHASVKAKLVDLFGRGDHVATGQIPFTPRAKKVLELSLREALSLGHDEIRSGHVLLGLMREGEGSGVRILVELGVSTADVRQRVVGALGGASPAPGNRLTLARVEHGPQLEFLARPDQELRRLLMRAAGHALADGRETVTVADLLAVIDRGSE